MKERIIVSDFDGTITNRDTLYHFFKDYASSGWQEVETLWRERKIGSKECLIREFDLVKNLSKELIEEFIQTMELDKYFKEFIQKLTKTGTDFIIVSDGIDYFINRILENNNLTNIKTISNHAEFNNDGYILTCPYENSSCEVNSGTCKCYVANKLKEEYKEIIYIGDGTSDFCIAKNVHFDKLFAKDNLLKYCKDNNIPHIEFETFKDIEESLGF